MGAQPEVEDGFVTWSLDSKQLASSQAERTQDEKKKD